jgi:hypothetical protein
MATPGSIPHDTRAVTIARTFPIGAIAAGWLLYAAIYAVTFRLSGVPLAFAIRAAFANAIPDGVAAFVALRVSARAGGAASRGPLRDHAARAPIVIALASGAKLLLIWIDTAVVHHLAFRFDASLVCWQTFLSAVVYVSGAAVSHAWMVGQRLREEEAHAARADALRAQAEMAALRAQLNPHFLFNTLHSALGLVRRDPGLAESALEKLGDLLHYAIRIHRDGVDWVAFAREWEFVQRYLDLESIRLGDRLRVRHDVDDAAMDRLVPAFSVQPLVENAVRHGIAPRAGGGQIAISVRMDAAALRVVVSNDADVDGSPRDEGDRATGRNGLGQRVLRDRLQVLYRGEASMTAGFQPDGTYTVTLQLPLSIPESDGRE